MKTVRFLGPAHLLVIDDHKIARDTKATVSNAIAERLSKMPGIDIEITDPDGDEDTEDSEEEMNDGAI